MKHLTRTNDREEFTNTGVNGLSVRQMLDLEIPPIPKREKFHFVYLQLLIDPGSEDEYHYHNFAYDLFIIDKGEVVAVVNNVEIPLKEGKSLLVQPSERHKLCNRTDCPCLITEIRLNVDKKDRLCD